jgi:hypothetical protein
MQTGTMDPGERPSARTPEMPARMRARYLLGLLWLVGTFLIVNAFFWILDLGIAGLPGLQWAPWVSLMWGLALAFHALAYLVIDRQLEVRLTQRHLDEAGRRQPGGVSAIRYRVTLGAVVRERLCPPPADLRRDDLRGGSPWPRAGPDEPGAREASRVEWAGQGRRKRPLES